MIDPTQPDYTNTPVSRRRPRFGYGPVDLLAPPCVTIITPFYNTGPVFHETARSVFQQSLQQWEWLIINDGSTDPESLTILDGYRQRDPRLRVIDHDTNRGLSAARNTGFRAARAPSIVQLDSDDLLEPTAVEKWGWFLESYPEYAVAKGYTVGFGSQRYLWQRGFHDGNAFLEANLVNPTSMIRQSVHQAVGGYDEADRGGLMDWDFWLRCASAGYWGGTVPEYLDWYRRRLTHADRWPDFDNGIREKAYREKLREKYGVLWNGHFPQIQLRWHMPNETVPDMLPWGNRLRKDKPRLLLLTHWLSVGGVDQFNLDLLAQFTRRGWEVTVITTLPGDHSWLAHFAQYTSDIFILHHFLRPTDYPRFIRYVIHSRQIEIVVISHSELGYLLLPYLRAHFPAVSFVDLCHIEEESWKNGGYPRMAVEYQELLDLNIVVSEHLKGWMVKKGGDSQRIHVCYLNIDPDKWQPDPERRTTVRRELGFDSTVPIILYAARLCEQKQPRVFGQTLLRLCQKNLNFGVLVAGDGPDLEWLRAFVKRHGVENCVRLLGAVSNERIRALMTAADIFFLPSRWEGIALSLYEAMACSLPVVGADVGGQRELVTPECGVLIARGDEETEADQYAQELAGLLQDPRYRQEMGQAGRRRVSTSFHIKQREERISFLFQEAQRLHTAQPRPIPGLGLGRACAAQAVEYVRLSDAMNALWQEREQGRTGRAALPPYLLDPYSDRWRTLVYFTIRRLLLPYYRAALNREMKWLLALKDRFKWALLREGRS